MINWLIGYEKGSITQNHEVCRCWLSKMIRYSHLTTAKTWCLKNEGARLMEFLNKFVFGG